MTDKPEIPQGFTKDDVRARERHRQFYGPDNYVDRLSNEIIGDALAAFRNGLPWLKFSQMIALPVTTELLAQLRENLQAYYGQDAVSVDRLKNMPDRSIEVIILFPHSPR